MESTDAICIESQIVRTFATESSNNRTLGYLLRKIVANRGLISIAANFECGRNDRRMWPVKAPVPGPYSRTASAFSKPACSIITWAKYGELGMSEPTAAGLRMNWLTNSVQITRAMDLR